MKKTKAQINRIKRTSLVATGTIAAAITLALAFKPIPDNKAWEVPPTAGKVTNPIASNAASIEAGKAIYKKSCIDCHGPKGKGDGPKSADLDKNPQDFTKAEFQNQSDGSLFWKITEGRKPMPSFKGDLSKDQRWQVINYVRTLGKK
jgi:mono/diheme cytochrome c family protein